MSVCVCVSEKERLFDVTQVIKLRKEILVRVKML